MLGHARRLPGFSFLLLCLYPCCWFLWLSCRNAGDEAQLLEELFLQVVELPPQQQQLRQQQQQAQQQPVA